GGDDGLGLAPEPGHQRRDVAAHEGVHAARPRVRQVLGEALPGRRVGRRRSRRRSRQSGRSILDRGRRRRKGGGERFLRLGPARDRNADENAFSDSGRGLLLLRSSMLSLSFYGLVVGHAHAKVAVDVLGQRGVSSTLADSATGGNSGSVCLATEGEEEEEKLVLVVAAEVGPSPSSRDSAPSKAGGGVRRSSMAAVFIIMAVVSAALEEEEDEEEEEVEGRWRGSR
ncbi:LOW QUALITY PROTEIN: hypothetical protein CRUP_024745, partial [Coryphaenoides rupestris]